MTLPIYTKINVTPLSLVHGLYFQICRFMGLILRSVEAWKLGRGLAEGRRECVAGHSWYKGRNEKTKG